MKEWDLTDTIPLNYNSARYLLTSAYPEECCRILADSKSGAKQWAIAAVQLVSPPGVCISEGGIDRRCALSIYLDRYPLGEPLRSDPSINVADLLNRRAHDILAGAEPGDQRERIAYASYIALALYRWDPPASLHPIRNCMLHAVQIVDRQPHQSYLSLSTLQHLIVSMTLCRLSLHDVNAMSDYIDWLHSENCLAEQRAAIEFLEPFWRFPDDQLSGNIEWLVKDPQSPISRGKIPNARSKAVLGEHTPAIGVASIRSLIIRQLRDPKPMQTIEVPIEARGNGQADGASAQPRTTRKVIIRWCDEYASLLSRIEGMPVFESDWTEERRDEAIKIMIERLNTYGDRYRWNAANEDSFGVPPIGYFLKLYGSADARWTLPHLNLPALDHPASPGDVADGNAIFSLTGQVRVVDIKLPVRAKHIIPGEDVDRPREITWHQSSIARLGAVLQAEEQQQADGSWKCFYGFAGPGVLAAIPADSIELLPGGRTWKPMNGATDYAVCLEGAPDEMAPRFVVGSLPAFLLKARNRLGAAKSVNSALISQRDDGRLVLASNVSLTLFMQTKRVSNDEGESGWAEIAAIHSIETSYAPAQPKTLEPLEELLAGSADLQIAYSLSTPGIYEILVEIEGNEIAGSALSMTFEIII